MCHELQMDLKQVQVPSVHQKDLSPKVVQNSNLRKNKY